MPTSGQPLDVGSFLTRLAAETPPGTDTSNVTSGIQRLVEALRTGQTPDETATRDLEAIVSTQRPILQVQDGQVETGDTGFAKTGLGMEVVANVEKINRAASGVGYIRVFGSPLLGWVGTCFRVAESLVATTREVVEIFAGEEGGRTIFRKGLSVGIDFGTGPGTLEMVRRVEMMHPALDFALLEVGGVPASAGEPLAFDCAGPGGLEGRAVAVIGLQLGRPVVPLLFFQDRVAGKVVSPGTLVGMTTTFVAGSGRFSLLHDCRTLRSMSGAPVVDLSTGMVLGIHSAGERWTIGHSVPVTELARDRRVRSLPLGFPGAPPPDPDAWSQEWHERSGDGLVSAEVPSEPASPAAPASDVADRLATLYPTEDSLVEFIGGLGPDYAAAVAAQPGRGRSDKGYYKALAAALERRGLIDDEFLGRIGIGSEATAMGHRWLSTEELGAIVDSLHLHDIKGGKLNGIILGSPYWNLLSENNAVRPLPESLDKLARDQRAQARDALAWLLSRIKNTVRIEGEAFEEAVGLIDIALIKLGVSSPTGQGWAVYSPGSEEIVDLSYLAAGLEAARSVGRISVGSPDQGPRKGGSSCWLIAPDLIVAAAHLLTLHGEGPTTIGSAVIPDINKRFMVEFDATTDAPQPARIELLDTIPFYDLGLDIMLLQAKIPILDRAPLQVRTGTLAQGGITVIHHPHLGPKKISPLGGRILENHDHEAVYLVATDVGSGGAPIFDREWKVAATHRARMPRASANGVEMLVKLGTGAPAMLEAIRRSSAGQAFWRRIVAAQRSMRSIDASLLEAEAAKLPIVIELLDAETSLPSLDGLVVLARTGPIVSAVATPDAARKLADVQGVIRIEASGAGGSIECAASVPYIGVVEVRAEFDDEKGDQALIGIIDDGADVLHEAFLDGPRPGGKTRILAMWDQKDPRAAAEEPSFTISDAGRRFVTAYGLRGGAVYVAEDIDDMVAKEAAVKGFPLAQRMHHGTVVGSIAAGRQTGDAAPHFAGGVAPKARLIVVRYDLDGDTVGNSAGHIQALTLFDQVATERGLPIVVNISNGMNSGAHDGSSIVEKACDSFCGHGDKAGRAIIKSAGNEGNEHRHSLFKVSQGLTKPLRWMSMPNKDSSVETSLRERIELWFHRQNAYAFWIATPKGMTTPKILAGQSLPEFLPNGNRLDAIYKPQLPNGQGMLELVITNGKEAAVEQGIWTLYVQALKVSPRAEINAWMEKLSNRVMHFIDDTTNDCTITVPGTAEHIITVGAVSVDASPQGFALGSRGPIFGKDAKPNLAAPGVAIRAAGAASSTGVCLAPDGTSLAAPHVAGVVALAMSRRRKKIDNQPATAMFTARDIKLALEDSCRHFEFAADPLTGHGVLNAVEFMRKME